MHVGFRGLSSRQGFSLVEMMIAVGLTATVAMGSLAMIQYLGQGVKGASDTADITSTLSNVSTLLADATMCRSALSAVQKGKQSAVPVPDFMRESDAAVLGAPYFDWGSEVGEFQEVSGGGIHNAGLIGIPTLDGGISQVLLASTEVAEIFGLPQTIPGNNNVRVAQMGLVRLTRKEEVLVEGDVCRVQMQFRVVFEKIDRRISSGASRFERNFLLNTRVACENGQEGVQPIVSCGMTLPSDAQSCTDLGGEYMATAPVGQRCLFRSMRIANTAADRSQTLELNPDPLQGTLVTGGFTDILPGRIQQHGNSNTAFVLDTAASSIFDAGQIAFSKSYGSLSSRAVIPGNADVRAAQVPLGGMTFRGLNQVSFSDYSSAPNNGREFTQAAQISVTTDGDWGLDSSPTRMNFSTTRRNNDTWYARGAFASAVSDRPELLRVYPDKISGHGTIPSLSIRADQRVELAAELRFGVGTRIGNGTDRSEPQPTQSYAGAAAANTTAAGLRVSHRRGGSLGILSIPVSSPGYGYRSKLALSSESDLITVLQLRNSESGENLDLEARDLAVRDIRARDVFVTGNPDEIPSSEIRNPKPGLTVLAAADSNGRARWFAPKFVKMAGSVNLTAGEGGVLNLSTCTGTNGTGATADVTPGIQSGANTNKIYCHNLQMTNGEALPNNHPILPKIGMNDIVGTRRSPSPDNAVQWDMCYLSENVVTRGGGSGEAGGCVLNLETAPHAWKLTGVKGNNQAIKCEAFCLKMVFE